MHVNNFTHWAQDEWGGWYFEYKGIPALVDELGGGPVRVKNTIFDYSLSAVWDFKVHSSNDSKVILNAMDSTDEVLAQNGFGFVVLSAIPEYDEGQFRDWQRNFRVENGKIARERTRPRKYVRKSKVAITPYEMDVFYIPTPQDLEHEAFGIMRQGRQGSGALRKPKYMIDMKVATGTKFHLAHKTIGV